jgi:PhnB protein
MLQINPYLTFNGNCAKVMSFYKECLGGELILNTVKDSPMAKDWPANMQDNILHSSLTGENFVLLGSDMGGPGDKMTKGNTISLSLNCSTEDELNNLFEALSKNGTISRPLHKFFGGTIGTLTDQFGMDWVFYHNKLEVTK